MDEILLGLIWYAVLLFALTFHEAAHAWAAQRGGDPTAYHLGQVSLDPLPHIRREPLGTVFVPLLSYAFAGWMIGWANTPYDVRWADAHPRRAAWMSLAGPTANLVLVLLSGLAIRLGVEIGIFHAPEWIGMTQVVAAHGAGTPATLATLVSISFTLNLLLLVFNLIPLPPLDGSGAIGLLLSEERARNLRRFFSGSPQLSMLGLLAAWFLIEPLFHPIHLLAVNLLYPGVRYG